MANIKLINVIETLPWHKTKKWGKRNLSLIDRIVVHQMASPQYPGFKDIENNNKYFITPSPNNHISKDGCPHIPYHIIIDTEYRVYWCNRFEDLTWHCKGNNTNSIGVCVMGSFDGPSFKGKDKQPMLDQVQSLKKILDNLIEYQFNPLTKNDVYGHGELSSYKKNCPGIYILNWLKNWRNN